MAFEFGSIQLCFFLVAESTREWANEYGNVFQLELLTNNRVRLLSLSLRHEIRAFAVGNHARTSSCQGTFKWSLIQS